MIVTASVVLYQPNIEEVKQLVCQLCEDDILTTLYIIDNSPKFVADFNSMDKVVYIHSPSNPGFGAAHNIALKKSLEQNSSCHFVVNPDVSFQGKILSQMVAYMQKNKQIGMMMPQILNMDGSIQNLPKLLPSPYSVLMRKLKFPKFIYDKFIAKYELRNVPKDKIYQAPILSGCFTLFNTKALKDVGLYDDDFFMYFEDWDISRRMHQKYQTIFYPKVSVYHGYESGANKSKKLFKIFIQSAICYFNKWGWIFDKDRVSINKKTLAQFK